MAERILAFALGAALGSFVSVLVSRVRNKESKSIIAGRSRCPHCQKPLAWFELIPIFSYLIQAGRCRKCRKLISFSYLVLELSLGLVGVLGLSKLGWGIAWVVFMLYAGVLVAIALYDIQTREVPDAFVVGALALGLVFVAFSTSIDYRQALGGLALGILTIGFLVGISKGRWMGAGDIGVAGAVGVVLSLKEALVAIWLAFVLGALVGVALLATARARRKSKIAFTPFLVAGGLLAFFQAQLVIKLIWL